MTSQVVFIGCSGSPPGPTRPACPHAVHPRSRLDPAFIHLVTELTGLLCIHTVLALAWGGRHSPALAEVKGEQRHPNTGDSSQQVEGEMGA